MVAKRIGNNLYAILALYRADYTISLHIRAMAKLIGTSHVALLPSLKHLESLKILNSKRIGRNKQYRLNIDNILTKYYLAITEELATINYLERNFLIKKLCQHIANIDISTSILLFGSQVKGYATEESDIDLLSIGILSDNELNQIKKFETAFGKNVNIKAITTENFNTALRTGDILIKEALANHIILLNPDPFVTMVWRQHVER